jgi:cytochrome c peroxidase
MKTYLPFFLILFASAEIAFADAEKNVVLDPLIRTRLKMLGMHGLEKLPANANRFQFELGKKLFGERLLSGNKRISCQSCHNPEKGTSDGFPMSQTENGKGILRRNAPHLFNAGMGQKKNMFWDGRVQYDFAKKIFTTPEPDLNGVKPKLSDISNAMKSALAAQALFPMVTSNEMRGAAGENEIADAKSNQEAWSLLTGRIKKQTEYQALIKKSYPEVNFEKINIGHLTEAIAVFEKEAFQSTEAPVQKYLRGENSALTNQQKRGFVIFMNKCMSCHSGNEFGNNELFSSVSAPEWGQAPLHSDLGRAEISKNPEQNFFFKTPSLLNVSLTAPYMHNGAYQTLSEVIEHYNHLSKSLNGFEVDNDRRSKIPVDVEIQKNPNSLDDIWLSSQSAKNPKIENRLFLTDLEKKYLEVFLREALTDKTWVRKNK